MKVSTSQMFLSTSSQLAKQSGRINELQAKISTGEKLLSPSEEPQRAALINQLESTASQISTYQKNLDKVDGRLSIEEAILTSVYNIMGRIRDLSLAGASGTYSQGDKAIVVQEIRGLRDELLSLANSQDSGGNYIFAGTKVTTVPYQENAAGEVSYYGDSSSAVVSTGPNSNVKLNRPGSEVFSKVTDGGVDYSFFDVIDGMADALMGTAKQETVSASFATSETQLNSGDVFNLEVSVGKTTPVDTVINVATDTPEGIVTAINESSTGLTATLVKEDPASDEVRIYIEGPAGEEGVFTISTAAGAPGTFPNITFSNNDAIQRGIGRVSESKNLATDALVGIGVSMSVVNEKKDVNEERDLAIKKLISSEKDLDYALAVTELSSEIIALEALQSSFAKISQMSLFDYLR